MSSMASATKVFTIRRAYSNALFSVKTSEKLSVLAFKSKLAANKFVAMEKSMWPVNRPQQPLRVEDAELESLTRRCALNTLTLTLFNDNGEYELIHGENDLEDIQYHLNNVIKYYS